MIKFKKNSLNIVAYHYVREIKKSNYPNLKGVEFDLFKRQLKFFKKNFYLLPVDEMIEIAETNPVGLGIFVHDLYNYGNNKE